MAAALSDNVQCDSQKRQWTESEDLTFACFPLIRSVFPAELLCEQLDIPQWLNYMAKQKKLPILKNELMVSLINL